MTKALSTKNYVLVLFDKSRFFLDETEAEAVKNALKGGAKYIEIGESLIMSSAISRLVSGENYDEGEKIRRGEWKCKYDEWHERNQQCGHGMI